MKWLKNNKWGLYLILGSGFLILGATTYLVIRFKDIVFSQSSFAILIFMGMALVIGVLVWLGWKVMKL